MHGALDVPMHDAKPDSAKPAHDRQTTSPHAHHTPSVHAPRTTLGLGTGQRRLTEPGPPRHMRPEPPQPTGPGRARYRDSGQPQQMGPEQRWQRKTRRPELRNGPAREDPNSRTRSEMNSPRRREPRLGNSWLLTCRCQEPAYPMCPHWGLARGTRRPPSNPLPSAPLRGWRAGDCAPRTPCRCALTGEHRATRAAARVSSSACSQAVQGGRPSRAAWPGRTRCLRLRRRRLPVAGVLTSLPLLSFRPRCGPAPWWPLRRLRALGPVRAPPPRGRLGRLPEQGASVGQSRFVGEIGGPPTHAPLLHCNPLHVIV